MTLIRLLLVLAMLTVVVSVVRFGGHFNSLADIKVIIGGYLGLLCVAWLLIAARYPRHPKRRLPPRELRLEFTKGDGVGYVPTPCKPRYPTGK